MKEAVVILFGLMSALLPLALGEQLKCYFSYDQEMDSSGIPGGGAYARISRNAFAIFDTEEQKIKIVVFLNTKPGLFLNGWFEYFGVDVFAAERTLNVKKRDESGPVMTLSELFDFETTVWFGHEETLSANGIVYYRTLSVSEDGSWEKHQFDSRSESPWTTTGKITGFTVFSGPRDATLQIEQERIPGYWIVTSGDELGLRYRLFTSTDLCVWVRAKSELDSWWQGESLDRTGTPIGTGWGRGKDLYMIERSKMQGSAFFRLEVSELEYDHL